MNTHEEYVTYDQAKALKELGFNYPCQCHYTKEDAPDDCVWIVNTGQYPTNSLLKDKGDERATAPTQAVATRWLREKKDFLVEVRRSSTNEWYYGFCNDLNEDTMWDFDFYATYEQCLSAGIDYALKLLEGEI